MASLSYDPLDHTIETMYLIEQQWLRQPLLPHLALLPVVGKRVLFTKEKGSS